MIIKFASQKHATKAIIQMKLSKVYNLTIHKQNYIYIYIHMQVQFISVKVMEKMKTCCTKPRKFLPAVYL